MPANDRAVLRAALSCLVLFANQLDIGSPARGALADATEPLSDALCETRATDRPRLWLVQ